MQTFFRLLKTLEQQPLAPEAKKVLTELTNFVRNGSSLLVKNSSVANDICMNYQLTSKEMCELYRENGINKSESTIRDQQKAIGNICYEIFGTNDHLTKAFLNNDIEALDEISNRIYSMTHGSFTLSDLSVNLAPILPFANSDNEIGTDYKTIDNALIFLKSTNKKLLAESLDNFDSNEKKEVLSTILKVMLEPMLKRETYEITNDIGEVMLVNHLVFNEEKSHLLNRQRELKDALPGSKPEKVVVTTEKIVYKEPEINHEFMSMQHINEIIKEYLNNNCDTEHVQGSGKDMHRAENFLALYADETKLRSVLQTINPFDLKVAYDALEKGR